MAVNTSSALILPVCGIINVAKEFIHVLIKVPPKRDFEHLKINLPFIESEKNY